MPILELEYPRLVQLKQAALESLDNLAVGEYGCTHDEGRLGIPKLGLVSKTGEPIASLPPGADGVAGGWSPTERGGG